jgi:hypothetical protein
MTADDEHALRVCPSCGAAERSPDDWRQITWPAGVFNFLLQALLIETA